jgi:hypothetical protein
MTHDPRVPRRNFLQRAAAAVVGWRAAAMVAPAMVVAAPRIQQNVPPPGFLTPSYLPVGFQAGATHTDRLDGFGGGKTELALVYRRGSTTVAWSNPLTVYQAMTPQHDALATTEHRSPEAAQLLMRSGERVVASYHDGMWQPAGSGLKWMTASAHSLTFVFRGMRIGVRGSRLTGVTRDELVRVAQSLA